MGACFLQIGRRQIHSNAADRKGQTAALCRSPHPFPGFLHRRIGQTNDIKSGKSVGNEALRRDAAALDSGDSQCPNAANHTLTPSFFVYTIILHVPKKHNLFFCFPKNKENSASCTVLRLHSCASVRFLKDGWF